MTRTLTVLSAATVSVRSLSCVMCSHIAGYCISGWVFGFRKLTVGNEWSIFSKKEHIQIANQNVLVTEKSARVWQADKWMWCHCGCVSVSDRRKLSQILVHCRHYSADADSLGCMNGVGLGLVCRMNVLWSLCVHQSPWFSLCSHVQVATARRGALSSGSSWLDVSRSNET